MTLDLDKVAPASEWEAITDESYEKDFWFACGPLRSSEAEADADAELMHELRLAFDVQQRRLWWAVPLSNGWCVDSDGDLPWKHNQTGLVREGFVWDRPSQALVEADWWMTEQEAKR